jgi:AcrR family transcriptional regulator
MGSARAKKSASVAGRRRATSPPSSTSRKERRGRPATPFLRERILQSAADLFAEKPFDAVLVDDVAIAAGVGKGSVYRQFGSKEELYAAVVIDGFVELQEQIRRALADSESVRDRITAVVRHTLGFFWSRRQFFLLLRDPKALQPRREQQYRAHRHELSRLVVDILNDGVKSREVPRSLDTRVAAEALLGMLRGINRYSRDYTDPERVVETVTTIFFDGCLVKPTGSGLVRSA